MLAFVGITSCTDDWDNHYDVSSSTSYDGSIMAYIKSVPELSDFAEILEATGYDKELSASQVMTVMAPKNDSFDKAELLKWISEGKTDKVIDEFIKNHVCRYNRSITSEEQRVLMLNNKIVTIGTQADAKIGDSPVSQMNVSCNNGVVHVLDSYIPYAFNIFEFLADNYENGEEAGLIDPEWETMYKYLAKMQIDSLDENRSVSHGIDDNGNRIWVDSVIIENNKVLRSLDAYLFREDSTYLTIVPSFEAYNKRYQGIKSLFNFNVVVNSDPVVRDSLQRYWAHYYTLADLNYNLHMNNISDPTTKMFNNGAPVDTIFSTAYNRWNWPYNVYHWPFRDEYTVEVVPDVPDAEYSDEYTRIIDPDYHGDPYTYTEPAGILFNYNEAVRCSNGWAYTMDEIPFSVFTNVFKKITLEAENTFYIYYDGDEMKFTNTQTTTLTRVNNPADSISGNGYMHVIPNASTRQVEFTYYLPNTLSGAYDIYIKFLPLQVYDETKVQLPVQFRASLFERSEDKGLWPASTAATYKFTNPNPPDPKQPLNYRTTPGRIDSLYIGTYKFKNCYNGISPGVMLKLESNMKTSENNKTLTKEMLIDKIVLVPNMELHDRDGLYIESEELKRR